jgi:MFS family permease
VLGSAYAGNLGNRYGRWQTCAAGLAIQGSFYALGPKGSLPIMIVSMIGLGLGMGLVDGVVPALLGAIVDDRFGGTGVIYAMSTAAVQSGFMVGPIGGGALMEMFGFWAMSIILGSAVFFYTFFVVKIFRGTEEGRSAKEIGAHGGDVEMAVQEAR